MANKYKGAATSISFQQRGTGLYRGLDKLEAKRKDEIDAIKLAQLQAKEHASNFISGVDDKQRFEQGVLVEKQELEGKVRAHKYEALSKFAQTDVARLQGEADAKLKYAEYLKDLAPKAAAAAGKLARGGLMFADKLVGIQQWNKANANGQLDNLNDGIVNNNWTVAKRATEGVVKFTQEGDPEAATDLQKKTVNFSSYWAQRKLLNHIKENQFGYQNEIIQTYGKAKGILNEDGATRQELNEYGEGNAVEVMDLGARELLAQMGVSERSPVGKEIIEQFRTWGSLDRNNFYKIRKVEETAQLLIDLEDKYNNASEEDKPLLFENLVLATKNGWYNQNGQINNPGEGQVMTYADAYITSMKQVIKSNYGKKPGWSTAAEIKERFLNIKSIKTDKEEPVPILEKMAKRWDDEIIPYVETLAETYRKEDEKIKKIKGGSEIVNWTQKAEALANNTELDSTGKETARLKYISDIAQITGITETDRAILYNKFGYTFTANKSNVSNYINFHNAVLTGDEYTAMQIYNTSEDKSELVKSVEFIKKINSEWKQGNFANFIEYNSNAFDSETANSFKGKELNAKVENSSITAKNFYQARIQEHINGGMTIAEAQKVETDELRKGVGGDKNSIYFVEHSKEKGKKVFRNFETSDSITSNTIHEYFKGSERSEAAWDDIKDLEILEISADQLKTIAATKDGKLNLLSLLKDRKNIARLISPVKLEAIRSELVSRSFTDISNDAENPFQESVSDLIPQNVKDIAKAIGKPPVILMNGVLSEYFGSEPYEKNGKKISKGKYHINKDSQSVATSLNDDNYVDQRDVAGYNVYNNAVKGNGFLPMRPITRMCIQEDKPVLEAFRETNGLTWSTTDSGFIVDDLQKFHAEGGPFRLIEAGFGGEVLEMYGFNIPPLQFETQKIGRKK